MDRHRGQAERPVVGIAGHDSGYDSIAVAHNDRNRDELLLIALALAGLDAQAVEDTHKLEQVLSDLVVVEVM
jgi:hypothetical protein